MNKTLKNAIRLAIPSIVIGFGNGVAYGNNCTSAMIANPVYDADTGTATIPLMEVLDDPSGTLDFVAAELQQIPEQFPLSFVLTGWTQLGNDCAFVNTSTPTFDFNTSELKLLGLQTEGKDAMQFYEATLKWGEGAEFTLQVLGETEGRYSGRVIDANGQPITGATASLNGIEAEQSTNGEGHFTVVGIGPEICQILTVNAASFAPITMEVDIRFSDLTPCASS